MPDAAHRPERAIIYAITDKDLRELFDAFPEVPPSAVITPGAALAPCMLWSLPLPLQEIQKHSS